MEPVKLGIVGCGVISDTYLSNCTTRYENVAVVACADLIPERAAAQAKKYGVPKSGTVDELLADPEVELVVNLTVPNAHAEVGMAALHAGKSLYNEKPLSVSQEDGRTLLAAAEQHGLRVGAAPDTFLGPGLQTCRRLIDDGAIGEPVAATAFMLGSGPESWHRDPFFFYQPGAGPLFDIGPYYLTALIAMLGPVRRVTASARASFPERTITAKGRAGEKIPVNTPTHIASILDFAGGPVATVVTSFDVQLDHAPRLEIYGAEGSLRLPDPNTFGGPVQLWSRGGKSWQEVPLAEGHTDNNRGIGVADMAAGLRDDRPHRASGDLAFHVLEIMHACLDASLANRHIEIASRPERPAPLA